MTKTEQSAHDYAESQSSGLEGQARADKYRTCYNAFMEGANGWIHCLGYPHKDMPNDKRFVDVAYWPFNDASQRKTARAKWDGIDWLDSDNAQFVVTVYAWKELSEPPQLKPV